MGPEPRFPFASCPRRRQAGFTLLELLVALALLGLMAVVLTGGLRFGARVWEASRISSEATNEVAVIRAFIRERAMAVRPVRLARREGGLESALSGDRQGLNLVTLMPSYASQGGLYRVALRTADRGDGLRLTWWPLGGAREGPGSGTRLLLEGARGMAVSYFGNPENRGEMTWRDDWPEGSGLPRLLSIKVGFPEGDARVWPELVVSLPVAFAGGVPDRRSRREIVP